VQTGAVAIILWQGIPVYRRILAGSFDGPNAGPTALILATFAVVVVQGAYWFRVATIPSLQLPRHILAAFPLLDRSIRAPNRAVVESPLTAI
jgi:hypothetical protein